MVPRNVSPDALFHTFILVLISGTIRCTMVPVVILALLWSLPVCGQDLSVPTGWRSPTSTLSTTDRAQIAQTVIDTVTPLFSSASGRAANLTFGQNGHMLSSISLHDFYVSSQVNNGIVTQWLGDNVDGFEGGTNETLTWAVAAANAYRAYGDSTWLNMAVSVWNQVNGGCSITTGVATSGVMTGKNVTVPGQCNGKTTVGGMFLYGSNPTSLLVNMDTLGGFMSLSALLFEATGNPIYGTATETAFEFARAHLFDGQVIIDGIDLSTCSVVAGGQSSGCGFVIESLSIYLNKTTDQSASDFLKTLIPTAIKFPGFTSSNGVISEGPTVDQAEGFGDYNAETANKAIFIRGLHEAWSRMAKDSNLAQLIQSYVIVQYNALLDLAKSPDNEFYSPRWQGPPATKFIPWGQYTASNVMNAALSMSLTNTTLTGSNSSIPSPMASDNSMPTQHHTNVGVIVGATVGGIVFIVIILVTAILVMRRQRGHTHGGMAYDRGHMSFNGTHESAVYSTASYTITPFTQGSLATYSSVYSSPPASVPSRIPNASEQESIPELVNRLNQAMTAQPAFNAPPEYTTVAGNQAPSGPTVTITGKRRS